MTWKVVLSFFALATSLVASGAHAQATQGNWLADTQAPLYVGACSPEIGANTLLLPENNRLSLNNWYGPQDPVYAPFATYSLTSEQQAYYLSLIQLFWPGTYAYMQAWEVSDEMAQIINAMIEAVANCSQGIAAVQVFTQLVFDFIQGDFPKTPEDWYYFIEENFDVISQALGNNRYNRKYMACLNSVAWYWRSTFEMTYLDY